VVAPRDVSRGTRRSVVGSTMTRGYRPGSGTDLTRTIPRRGRRSHALATRVAAPRQNLGPDCPTRTSSAVDQLSVRTRRIAVVQWNRLRPAAATPTKRRPAVRRATSRPATVSPTVPHKPVLRPTWDRDFGRRSTRRPSVRSRRPRPAGVRTRLAHRARDGSAGPREPNEWRTPARGRSRHRARGPGESSSAPSAPGGTRPAARRESRWPAGWCRRRDAGHHAAASGRDK
jgi:hypothetical protein